MAKRSAERRHGIWRIAAFGLVMYLLLLGMMAAEERRFLYQPFDGPSDPAQAGAEHFTRRLLTRPTGSKLVYWENKATSLQPTIVYFHGNGGGLRMHMPNLNYLDGQHFHVMALEYPGYPGSEGRPSQKQIIADALMLYDHAARKQAHAPVIWGYSLGTGVAAQVAAQRRPSALILEAPFTAVVDRASELFPFFPVRQVMRDQYRSRDVIGNVRAPVLIIHGESDRIIPVEHGRALFELAHEPKLLHTYPEYEHLNLIKSTAYQDATDFIHEHTKR